MDGRRWGWGAWILFAACVSTDDGASDGSSSTGGPVQCLPVAGFDCSVPIPSGDERCSADPTSLLDENCCMRPRCGSHADCEDGLVCAPVAIPYSCADQIEDGETVCSCGAPPNGRLASLCVPPESVQGEWCNTYFTQDECNAVEPIPLGPNDVQMCQWIDLQNVSIGELEECRVDEPSSRCLTIQQGYDPGCAAPQCTSSDGAITLGRPVAHAHSGGTGFEVFGVDDVFCGSGFPVGEWVSANDASLGVCAFTCE